MTTPETSPDDAASRSLLDDIEARYLEEIEDHKEQPCNWCLKEKTGSFDCGTVDAAIKSAIFVAALYYQHLPPRKPYKKEDK